MRSQVHATLSQERRALEAAGAAVFVCDGGDWFQGTPESQIERGLGFLRAMSAVGYDGAVVGNHEFDEGALVLLRMANGGTHPVDGDFGGDVFPEVGQPLLPLD